LAVNRRLGERNLTPLTRPETRVRQAARVNKIARLLAEAGLRSPAACATLVNAQGWTMVDRRARESGGEIWFGPPYVPANLFTGCITLAVKQHKISPLPFEVGVSLISDLPPVRILRKLNILRIIALLMIYPLYFASSLVFLSTLPVVLAPSDPAAHGVLRTLTDIMGGVGLVFFWNTYPYFVEFALLLISMALMGFCFFGFFLSHQITELISSYRAILGCPDNYQKKHFVGRGLFKSWAIRFGRPSRKRVGIATHLFFSPRSRKSFEMLRKRGWSVTNGSAHLPGVGPRSDV
jgi:hypothetical protein